MADRSVKVRLSVDNAAFMRSMQQSDRAVNTLSRDLDGLARRIDTLSSREISVRAKLDDARLRAELHALGANKTDVTVKANLDTAHWKAQAEAEAAKIKVTIRGDMDFKSKKIKAEIRGKFEADTKQKLQAELNAMRLSVRVRVTTGRLSARQVGIGGDGGGGGGIGFAGAAAAGVTGLVSLLPQAVSLLSAAAAEATALAGQIGLAASASAGLVPILGSALQAFGAVKLGSSGVLATFKAYTQEQNAGTTATQGNASAARSAANGLISARQAVGQATIQAARSIEDALRSQTSAERTLADAQRASTQAQLDLVAARKQAQQEYEDLQSQVSNGLLAEREDVLSLTDAQTALAQATGDQGAAARARHEQRLEELASEKALGLLTTQQYQQAVQDAQSLLTVAPDETIAKAQLAVDKATQALADQRRENGRLADSQKTAQQVGIEGSQTVVAAQDKVTASIRTQQDAQEGVARAVEMVQRAQTDGAQSVADAQRALAQAQAAYADATTKTSATVSKLNEQMGRLGPNQRAFVQAVLASKDAYAALRQSVGEALFAGTDGSLQTVTRDLLPLFKAQLTDTASIVNRVGRNVVDDLAGPLKGRLAGALMLNNDLLTRSGPLVEHLLSTFLNLYNAAGPLAKRIADGAVHLAEMADSASSAGLASGKLTGFFDRAGDRAATLMRTAGDLGTALRNIFTIGNSQNGDLLDSLEKAAGRFRDFTESARGQNAIAKWFADGKAAGREFVGLIGDIRTEFGGLTKNTNAADIIDGFRTAVPYVADFVKAISGSGERGHELAAALLEIAQAMQQINAGGALTTFVSTLAAMVTGVSEAVQKIPADLAPLLTGIASAAGALLAVKFVVSPVLSLASSLTALYKSVAGASTLKLTLGGIGAVIGAAVLAYGAYSTELNKVKRSIDGVSDAMHGGSIDQLRQANDQLRAAADSTTDLYKRVGDRGVLSTIFHIGDDFRFFADKTSGALDKQNQALLDSTIAMSQYDDNVSRYLVGAQGLYGATMTATDAQSLFAAAGVTVSDTYGVAVGKINSYKAETAPAAQATRDFAKDMTTLSDSTSTASDKADALRRVLHDLSTGQADLQGATIAYKDALDAVGTSVHDNGRGLDDNTAAGRRNGQALLAAKDALDGQIEAMIKSGATSDDVKRKYDEGTAALDRQLQQTGLTKDEIGRYQDVLGLTPPAKATELQVLGDLVATQKAQDFQGAIDALHGKDITITATAQLGYADALMRAGAQSLNAKLVGQDRGQTVSETFGPVKNANGNVLDFYANGGMREQHVAQIAPAGAMRVWAEPETGGESYIPLAPSKRARSTAIWQETGKRLGMYADGAVVDGLRHVPDVDLIASTAVGKLVADVIVSRSSTDGVAGAVSGGRSDLMGFLRSTDPLPYIWGGVGPGGYDCSGLAGEVWARATGHPSYRRYFTTYSFSPEHFGMRPGVGGVLSLGFNDHHVVGNYGGLPFEARSSKAGILVGSGVTSVNSMPRRYYLPGSTAPDPGQMGGGRQGDFGDDPAAVAAAQAQRFAQGGIHAPLGSVLNPHVRDAGGPLLPGWTYNGTKQPEQVEYVRAPQSVLMAQSSSAGPQGNAGVHIEQVNLVGSQATPRELARELAWAAR